MVWLECWNGLPRSRGVGHFDKLRAGLPVGVRVGIFDIEIVSPIKDSRPLRIVDPVDSLVRYRFIRKEIRTASINAIHIAPVMRKPDGEGILAFPRENQV
jgi:hypothetical protein